MLRAPIVSEIRARLLRHFLPRPEWGSVGSYQLSPGTTQTFRGLGQRLSRSARFSGCATSITRRIPDNSTLSRPYVFSGVRQSSGAERRESEAGLRNLKIGEPAAAEDGRSPATRYPDRAERERPEPSCADPGRRVFSPDQPERNRPSPL